jgi:hypothetical protein
VLPANAVAHGVFVPGGRQSIGKLTIQATRPAFPLEVDRKTPARHRQHAGFFDECVNPSNKRLLTQLACWNAVEERMTFDNWDVRGGPTS